MNFRLLRRGAAWMTPGELSEARRTLRALSDLFARRGVEETPLLAFRVDDLIVGYLLCRRAEMALAPAGEDAPDPPPAPAAVLDAVGKARERLRKSLLELESFCERAGAPIDVGLADEMRPIVRKAAGVAESAALRGGLDACA